MATLVEVCVRETLDFLDKSNMNAIFGEEWQHQQNRILFPFLLVRQTNIPTSFYSRIIGHVHLKIK
jgi:hypothetical protein